MKHWYVVNTRPNQEARAAVELANQEFPVFLPILGGRPMFPRYLFVQFDRDTSPWGKIRNTRGCIDLLRNGFAPSPVKDYIMEAIRAYRPPEMTPVAETEFTKGQMVQIVDGPLAGIQGLFQADVKKRTACLLEILGKRVEISKKNIRAA